MTMNQYNLILEHVQKEICPNTEEITQNELMFSKIQKYIKDKHSIDARLMGSVAKNTFIAGDKDLDIFIFFPMKTKKEELEKKGLSIGKNVFKKFGGNYMISYAEHPYTKGNIGPFEVEIVPAYKITSTEKLMSSVDRTPFHTKYVLDKLKKPNEVRLLKKFLKTIGAYGSNLKTGGFSGYLCELLIIKCGTFIKTLKHAQKWHYQTIIDMENNNTVNDYKNIKKQFKDQPLIFIDPTDKKRNVAAVLSKEKLAQFIYHAGRFLEAPTMHYFFPVETQIDKRKILRDAKTRGTYLITLTFPRPDLIDDILYPQMRRFRKRISDAFKYEGFIVLNSWEFADKDCGIAFELLSSTLPRMKKVIGPSIFDPEKNRINFAQKYENIWFEDENMIAETRRKFYDIDSMLADFLDDSQTVLMEKGIPNNIAVQIKKHFFLIEGKDLLDIESDEFWKGLNRDLLTTF